MFISGFFIHLKQKSFRRFCFTCGGLWFFFMFLSLSPRLYLLISRLFRSFDILFKCSHVGDEVTL